MVAGRLGTSDGSARRPSLGDDVALSEIDRSLLQQCLAHQPRSWEAFVDRFLGLVVHVVNHTASARSIRLSKEDREDLCADVFLEILQKDFSVLRAFRGQSSLATYLTVIARRVVVRKLVKHRALNVPLSAVADAAVDDGTSIEQRIQNEEEVQRLLDGLDDREAEVVRMYHLEGRSYGEISADVGVPLNSIGPTLSRAREKLRQARVDS
jgi:RNA polymerase sigma-70 factor (ECF subfamily)